MQTTLNRAAGVATPNFDRLDKRVSSLTLQANDALMMAKALSHIIETKIDHRTTLGDSEVYPLSPEDGELITWCAYHAEALARTVFDQTGEVETEVCDLRFGRTTPSDPMIHAIDRYHDARQRFAVDGAGVANAHATDAGRDLSDVEDEIIRRTPPVRTMAGAAASLRACMDEKGFTDNLAEAFCRATLSWLEEERER